MRHSKATLIALALAAVLPSAHAAKATKQQQLLAEQITRAAAQDIPATVTDGRVRTTGQYLRVTPDCQIEVGQHDASMLDSALAFQDTRAGSLQVLRPTPLTQRGGTVWKIFLAPNPKADVVRRVQALPRGQERVSMTSQIVLYAKPGSKLLDDLHTMADLCGAPLH